MSGLISAAEVSRSRTTLVAATRMLAENSFPLADRLRAPRAMAKLHVIQQIESND